MGSDLIIFADYIVYLVIYFCNIIIVVLSVTCPSCYVSSRVLEQGISNNEIMKLTEIYKSIAILITNTSGILSTAFFIMMLFLVFSTVLWRLQ